MEVVKLLGPPGTGKTEALMAELEGVLKAGVDPERIAFVSFSRRALEVARVRAAEHTDAPLTHFRTIHSTAYHLAKLTRGDVVQPEHLQEFGRLVGLPFEQVEDALWEGSVGTRCLSLASLASARGTSLLQEWRSARQDDLPWELVNRTVGAYEKFKESNALWDFNDMITKSTGVLDVDVLFVDEAQDTSAAQWKLLRRVAAGAATVFLAGDDDQAVYHWSGADPRQLLRFKAEERHLPHSYRLPRSIKTLADRVSRRIRVRVDKQFTPRDEDGRVSWINEPDMIDLHQGKSWLLLARSNYQLQSLRELAQRQGVVYTLPNGNWSWTLPPVRAAIVYERLRKGGVATPREVKTLNQFLLTKVPAGKETYVWTDLGLDRAKTWMEGLPVMPARDREYVRALRRTGESLSTPGRITISTVHGVKGEQADHVVLLTDLSERVAEAERIDPDAELRVQYVGVTRARSTLTLVAPKSCSFWSF